MPWLIQSTPGKKDGGGENLPLSSHLFFVHIPRCGGTSLMQHFSVPEKVIAARGPVGRLAMKYFFMRYAELEKSNFPIETKENAFCLVILCASVLMYLFDDRITEFFGTSSSTSSLSPSPSSILPISLSSFATFLGSLALFISFFTTVICTAPVIGRIMPVHRWYLWFVHYPIFRMCEALDWCTGTNKHGYIMHLTASKLLGYGYVKPEQMDNICSLAIVRDPYSRMVSIYGYNRFGEFETFPVFLRRWKKLMRHYIERGEKEDWYTPCHLLPQFEYTHFEGKQLVQSIVKQEELKYLKTRTGAEEVMGMDNTVSDLPDLVRDALLGMPHANSRKSSKQYYDYYDQESLDLTFEMYSKDFEVFGYNTTLTERPDLLPPKGSRAPKGGSANRRTIFADQTKVERMSRNILYDSVAGKRVSQVQLFSTVKTNVKQSMNRRSSTSAFMQSLSKLDKDELLAWIAGERTTFQDSGHKDD